MSRLEWICAGAVCAVTLALIGFLVILAIDKPCTPGADAYEQGGTR